NLTFAEAGMDEWDARYGEAEPPYGEMPNDFLVEQADALNVGDCLCLAEGQGRNAVWLAGQGFAVTAVDLSPIGLERARQLAAAKGVSIETRVADLEDYDPGDARW